jgi:hypothetical protein
LENKRRKKNYLVLDWSIDSLEGRYKYLEESGILKDLSDRRKSRFAKAQLNMITTYIFRSKDVKSGRKVDESYYIDDSSYQRSLKVTTYIDDIDSLEDDEDSDNNYFDDKSEDSINGAKKESKKENNLELDDEELKLIADLGSRLKLDSDSFLEDEAPDVLDNDDNYIHHIEEDKDMYNERLKHIEKLFDPKNINHTILRKIVTTYRNIHDTEIDNDIIKSNVEHIMKSILLCVDGEDDSKVIELLMQDMTEREISNVMSVSQQSVNKRIKKIFRKTIKLLNNE